jgi:hypothetical protein
VLEKKDFKLVTNYGMIQILIPKQLMNPQTGAVLIEARF